MRLVYHRGLVGLLTPNRSVISTYLIMVTFSFLLALYLFVNLSGLEKVLKPRTQNLEVHFLNVGQGDAIFIKAPNGNSMLIDSGPSNEQVIPEIQKLKSIFDRNIHILLATHADADHIGSMKKVSEKFQYQKFAYSGLESDTKIFRDLIDSISWSVKNQSIEQKLLNLTAGMSIILDSKNSVKFDVLFPDFDFQISEYRDCQKSEFEKNSKTSKKSKSKSASKNPKKDPCLKFINIETNLNSIVGKLSYGITSFMLTGDAPVEVERFIISENKLSNSPSNVRADVLKLGHHGSKTSTAPEFLEAVQPTYAIVSAGKDNRYGHPHKRVLDDINVYKPLKLYFKGLYRTDIDGVISFYSNGKTINFRTENSKK